MLDFSNEVAFVMKELVSRELSSPGLDFDGVAVENAGDFGLKLAGGKGHCKCW